MANRKVAIYESVMGEKRARLVPVELPRKKSSGGLYLKENRQGKFYISWYEGKRKRIKKVLGDSLGLALRAAEAKTWELVHPERVKEEIPDDDRMTIAGGIDRYLAQMVGSPLTIKEHRHALDEFHRWSTTTYVHQITRTELLRFKDWAKQQGNDELTAVWKIIRVNKFYKWALNKKPGEGLVKTTEFKKVLRRKPKVKTYSPEDLQKFFSACNPLQYVLFKLYYYCGLRNKEIAHLEWDDIRGREIDIHAKRLQNGDKKKEWEPKHGSEGKIVFPAELVPLLAELKAKSKCNLVFPTRNCRVNIKLLDQCKLVARRAGLDQSKWTIKSFRSTYATNRLRNGFDPATVREQLRHKDLQSINHYIEAVKNDKLIASGQVDAGWDA